MEIKAEHEITKQAGAGRPIICKRCGKKVGYVRIKWRFKAKIILYAALFAFILEFVVNALMILIFNR